MNWVLVGQIAATIPLVAIAVFLIWVAFVDVQDNDSPGTGY